MRFAFVALVLFLSGCPALSDVEERVFTLGTITIQNVTRFVSLSRDNCTFGVAVYDGNLDGWPDLIISNHGHLPRVFLNDHGRRFVERSSLLPARGLDHHSPVVADYDNDGDQDLYFLLGAHNGTGEKRNELYINPGQGQPFTLRYIPEIEDPKGRGRTAAWFDYDMDGFLDLFLANKLRADAPNRLFHNNGDGTFSDRTAESGLGLHLNCEGGVVAGDIDNDGDMDLVVTTVDDRPYLFINRGDGTFRDETLSRGIEFDHPTRSIGMADTNNDGFLDIYFTGGSDPKVQGFLLAEDRLTYMQHVRKNDPVDTLTFRTDPDAVLQIAFSENYVQADQIFIGARNSRPPGTSFSLGPGKIDPNGQPSLWKEDGSNKGTYIWKDPLTNVWTLAACAGADDFWSGALVISSKPLRNPQATGMEQRHPVFKSCFYVNQKNGTFRTACEETGLCETSYSARTALWADYDNDADLDLFVVNSGFNGPGKQPNSMFVNEGGHFQRYDVPMGPHEQFSRGDGGVFLDFDRDGYLDLFVLNGAGLLPSSYGPYQLFRNLTHNSNAWVEFKLVGGGAHCVNRDAVGARVRIVQDSTGRRQWRFILGGSGSDSQPDNVIHFGLGPETQGIQATVYWPPSDTFRRGHTQKLNIPGSALNRPYVVRELQRD